MKKWLTKRNVVILLLVVLGVVGWRVKSRGDAARKKAEIKIVNVERGDITEILSVSGKIVAERKAELNFQSVGKLAFVKFGRGEMVKRGEWIMGLDTGDLKAAETKAWYAYQTADANAKEVEDSVKDHDKDETFDQKNSRVAAQTARDSAYENWLSARRAVDNSILKAPFDGVVVSVSTQAVGDTVGVVDGVTVVDPKGLYFEIEIDEADLGKVSLGQEVIVKLDAFEHEQFGGVLGDIGFVPQLSTTGATVYPAKIQLPHELLDRLRLGMNGDGEIVLGRVSNVLTLPIDAIVDGVVERENGEKVGVETGLSDIDRQEVKSGVSEGEKFVVK